MWLDKDEKPTLELRHSFEILFLVHSRYRHGHRGSSARKACLMYLVLDLKIVIQCDVSGQGMYNSDLKMSRLWQIHSHRNQIIIWHVSLRLFIYRKLLYQPTPNKIWKNERTGITKHVRKIHRSKVEYFHFMGYKLSCQTQLWISVIDCIKLYYTIVPTNDNKVIQIISKFIGDSWIIYIQVAHYIL